ncbi:amidohydrolase family protein [Baekduia soli]|uniref:Amidohydrolase family protein n=1 Tax=Baekduia soli TaxID=496014 RepID=A0A5B8U3W3_9ACTN|nr:amidohydrolase family protein [Baekduia soli]QEC47565.1 amidohydrolase family protein [Baekduia soli]
MTSSTDAPVHDVVIAGGTVVGPRDERALDVSIDGERISGLHEPGTAGPAKRTIDATGCLVVPGAIDPHVHYGMDFQGLLVTEGPEYSAAAVHGGTTTVIDFAFQETKGPLDTLADRRAFLDGSMATDWSLHTILTREFSFEDIEQIGDVIRAGCPTIKTMMTYGWMSDDGRRYGAMCEVAEHGGLSLVHAEDDAIANWLHEKYKREGKQHASYVSETRGPLVEEAAVRRALFLAERAGSPLYVLHVAAGAAVDAIAEARSRGLPMYGETLSAYLSWTQENMRDETPLIVDGKAWGPRGLLYNNFPVPKFPADREQLWEAILDDRLQVVATDHCSTTLEDRMEKMGTTQDSMQAGQSAVELRVELLYSMAVATGRCSASRWVQLIATNPAQLMGLAPAKGEIAVGADADVVVFDPARQWTVDWRELHMSVPYSCWDGQEMTGKVRDVLRRGEVLIDRGNYVGSTTGGHFIERTLAPHVTANPLDPSITAPGAPAPAPAAA